VKVFKLYADVIPVKGAVRCTICDLGRGEVYYISQGLCSFLIEYADVPFQKILDEHPPEIREVLEKEVSFLLDNELGFFTESPEKFPQIELDWDYPSVITNAIIEHNNTTNFNTINILEQLDELGCKFIEFRFYDSLSTNELENVLTSINDTNINSIIVFLKQPFDLNRNELARLITMYPRLAHLHIFDSNNILSENEEILGRLTYHKGVLKDNSCCGNVDFDYFSINIPSFTEALKYNSCLNRKLSIAVNGDIKNCPSLPDVYGNLETDKIKDTIGKDMMRYWTINKNQIDVCKDCEFRYLCLDCRAFRQSSDFLSKPLKCNYDPYTVTWAKEKN
jgi:SPASM domain peptide maturase of grasp-with-spasm system